MPEVIVYEYDPPTGNYSPTIGYVETETPAKPKIRGPKSHKKVKKDA